MRSFQTLVALLFALFAFVVAQESSAYDETVFITSTIYKVNTISMSGTPTAGVANTTSTIAAIVTSAIVTPVYPTGNGTAPAPTATSAPSASANVPAQFTPSPGAASGLSANGALVAIIALGMAVFAL